MCLPSLQMGIIKHILKDVYEAKMKKGHFENGFDHAELRSHRNHGK